MELLDEEEAEQAKLSRLDAESLPLELTPLKVNMQPKNHLFELENHLNQTIIFQVPC